MRLLAGCSKTLMARAIATESRMNFLAVKGPELLSKVRVENTTALLRRARTLSSAAARGAPFSGSAHRKGHSRVSLRERDRRPLR